MAAALPAPAVFVACAAILAAACGAAAQASHRGGAVPGPRPSALWATPSSRTPEGRHGAAAPARGGQELVAVLRSPVGAFSASLLLPGAGQGALGLRRWVVYGATELAFWGVRVDAVRDEARFSRAYRDLAWDVAREPGGAAREDGPWGYYEAMSHYAESGRYDVDGSNPGLQPESDAGTYNGQIWALALSLYAPGGSAEPGTPGYARALDYYGAHAIGPAFIWSWTGHETELARFRGLIDDADGRARQAGLAAGLILANHLVSAVDAFLAARVLAGDVRLENRIDPDRAGVRWRVGLRIPIRQAP